jgi:hypothetical protein
MRQLLGFADGAGGDNVLHEINRYFSVPYEQQHIPRAVLRVIGVLTKDDPCVVALAAKQQLTSVRAAELLLRLRTDLAAICFNLFTKSKQVCCQVDLQSGQNSDESVIS